MSGTWLTTRAWLLMLPLLVVMISVIGCPLIDTVGLSFTDAKLVGTEGNSSWRSSSRNCRCRRSF
ncbi:hypothetical protein AB9F38_37095, partial [Rhizobium leguminosarum]